MKNFKFKLEGLLKIRKAKEQICKSEIGQVQKNIQTCRNQISYEREGISAAQDAHNKMLEHGSGGREIQFFPRFIRGKEINVELLKKEIKKNEEILAEKLRELSSLRADVKVIENLKEKAKIIFKKELFKKEEQRREENLLIWNSYKKEV